MGGMAWNLMCRCILTTFQTDYILVMVYWFSSFWQHFNLVKWVKFVLSMQFLWECVRGLGSSLECWCISNKIVLEIPQFMTKTANYLISFLWIFALRRMPQDLTHAQSTLVPYSTKPLPEPMLTKFSDIIWHYCNKLMLIQEGPKESWAGGRFKNTYELLNLRALKSPPVNKIHIFQCMDKIFHTKYLTHTLKDMVLVQH